MIIVQEIPMEVTKEFTFEAAHHLPNYDGKCNRIHGHSYKLQVSCLGNFLDTHYSSSPVEAKATQCMVMDFNELKKIVQEEVIDKLDHEDLNKFYQYPTAEVMTFDIYNRIESRLPKGILLTRVRLYETATSYAEFRCEFKHLAKEM